MSAWPRRHLFYSIAPAADGSHGGIRSCPPHAVDKSSGVPGSVAPPAVERRIDWGTVTLWAARVAWLAVAVVGGRAIGDAVADRSDPVRVVATAGAWAGWGAGVLALAVTGVVTLTAVRAIVPAAPVVAVVTAVAGADAGSVLALAVPAAVAAVLVAAADTGQVYVQASAYGDERRFALRPPIGYLLPTVVSWAVWLAAVIAAPLAWASKAWAVAAASTAVAVVASLLLPRRWHQLALRWLVAVPAGLVVHDPVVLAETVMLPDRQIAGVGLVRARGGGAADLTGPTPGIAVGVALAEAATVVLAARPSTPRGTAIHLTSFLVAPSRPGAVLREARRRGLPMH
jgi:hypothetical protein